MTSFHWKLLTALKQLNNTREFLLNLSNLQKHTELTLKLTVNISQQRELDLTNNQENI